MGFLFNDFSGQHQPLRHRTKNQDMPASSIDVWLGGSRRRANKEREKVRFSCSI